MLQDMDASGKDGVIRRGLAGIERKWRHVASFGPPTEKELDLPTLRERLLAR